jgi:uncharacterized protein (AIM24 family)
MADAALKKTANPGRPMLKATSADAETFAGVTYHLDGELVPVLTVEITPDQPVYFEHHIMLWKNTDVTIGLKSMSGAVKRMFAGLPLFVTEAKGQGMIAFSRDGAGHIVPIHLKQGDGIHVREHQFLAATNGVDYTFEMISGVGTMLFGGTGIFIDKFHCQNSEGILWVHGYGNVFEKTLAPGEQIEVEPGGWLYKDPGVQMDVNIQKLSSGIFGSACGFITNRFTGPGRVGLQSMYQHMSAGMDDRARQATPTDPLTAIGGGILNALLKN